MKQKFFTCLLCLCHMLGYAQGDAPTTGYLAANNGGASSSSSAVTVTGDDMVIAHGSIPRGESQALTSDLEELSEKIKVYPNPLGDCIFVETGFTAGGTIRCIFYDAAGKQLMNMSFKAERGDVKRIISTSKLAAGTYFLHTMYNGDVSSGTIFTIRKQ